MMPTMPIGKLVRVSVGEPHGDAGVLAIPIITMMKMAAWHASCFIELVVTEVVAAGNGNDVDVDGNAEGDDMVRKRSGE